MLGSRYYITVTLHCRCLKTVSCLLLQQRLQQQHSSPSSSGEGKAERRTRINDTHRQHRFYHLSVQLFVEERALCHTTSWSQQKNLVLWFHTNLVEGKKQKAFVPIPSGLRNRYLFSYICSFRICTVRCLHFVPSLVGILPKFKVHSSSRRIF